MYCVNCGVKLEKDSKFCAECGTPVLDSDPGLEPAVATAGASVQSTTEPPPHFAQKVSGVSLGFSPRINDPAFKKYVKNANNYAAVFSIVIALIAVISFYIAGERGVEGMSNPESLYIGFGIGGMFVIIALFQIMGRKRSKTWDGQVVNKYAHRKIKRVDSGSTVQNREVIEYTVEIHSDRGKKKLLSAVDDDTVYNYYQVGDKVRHHGGLNSMEKFDKTKDSIIFCSACATLCDITEDTCFRCKCPLLK